MLSNWAAHPCLTLHRTERTLNPPLRADNILVGHTEEVSLFRSEDFAVHRGIFLHRLGGGVGGGGEGKEREGKRRGGGRDGEGERGGGRGVDRRGWVYSGKYGGRGWVYSGKYGGRGRGE